MDQQEFRALMAAVPAALIVLGEVGEIADLSAQAEALFGYSRDEVIGHSVDDLIRPGREPGQRGLERPFWTHPDVGGRAGVCGPTLFGLRKDGSEFPVEISLSALEAGESRLAITAIRDISERVRADEERSKLGQALEAIRLRDDFLSLASHELKTPLTALQLQAESIIRSIKRGADVETLALISRKAGAIQGAAEQLTKLINQLLDLSRISAGRLLLEVERVDLASIVERVITQFADAALQQGCEIQFDVKTAVVGSWDQLRIEQIFGNLLSNAIKYGQGRPVVISVRTSATGNAVLEVRDQGIGIPIENQTRIFERFERLVPHRSYGGFGLGLWIVNQLVAAHHGTIRVWSQPGVGSTFTVELPLTDARPIELQESAAVVDNQCLMLVEDDAMTRVSFKEALTEEGFDILTAANGWEALRLLRAGIRPRLLFLDLIMPIMDAKTFIEHKASDPNLADIPVVIMSAAKGIEERCEALGAVTFLRKPVKLDVLLETVEQYARKARAVPPIAGRPD